MEEQSKTLRDIVNSNSPVEIDVFKYGKNSRERWGFDAFYRGGDAISAAGYSCLSDLLEYITRHVGARRPTGVLLHGEDIDEEQYATLTLVFHPADVISIGGHGRQYIQE